MKTDNEWHPAICVDCPDGIFRLYDTLEQAEAEGDRLGWTGEIKYEEVRTNYNRGQPLIEVGGMIVTVVDNARAHTGTPNMRAFVGTLEPVKRPS